MHITYLILLKYTELSKVQPVSLANTYVIFWSFEKVALKAKAVKVSYPKKILRPKIEHQTYLSVCLRAFLDQIEVDVKKYKNCDVKIFRRGGGYGYYRGYVYSRV